MAPEPIVPESTEEAKTETEVKEEKTPETPVTEPITNGSTTPESPKVESPVVEEVVPPSPKEDSPESQPETQPDQLPVNGLSLEETKETPVIEKNEEKKKDPTAETTEIAPEISVKKEVCVKQMPMIDTTPPPLPTNPPPSSVASFAATTMAPESTDASLANTADNTIPPPPSDPIAKDDELLPKSENELIGTQSVSIELSSPVKELSEESSVSINQTEANVETNEETSNIAVPSEDCNVKPKIGNIKTEAVKIEESIINKEVANGEISEKSEVDIPTTLPEGFELPEDKADKPNVIEDLPSPPAPICNDVEEVRSETNIVEEIVDNTRVTINEVKDIVMNTNHISETEESSTVNMVIGNGNEDAEQNVKTTSKDSLGNLIELIECNGNVDAEKLITENETTEIILPINPKEITNIESGRTATTPDDSMPPSLSEANESAPAAGVTSNDESESFPLPPSELCRSESEPSPPASPEPAHTPQVNTARTILLL